MLTRLVGFDEEAAKKPFVFDLPAQQKQLLIKIAETSSLVRFTPLSLLLCVHVCVCARVCVCVLCVCALGCVSQHLPMVFFLSRVAQMPTTTTESGEADPKQAKRTR